MNLISSSLLPNQLPNSILLPSYPFSHCPQEDKEKQSMHQFWLQQIFDIRSTEAFKNNKQLPLSRVKRIVKSDKAVKMVSAEVPLFMAKASEIFIQELTFRGWILTEQKERCTLQNRDLTEAVSKKHVLHFLTNLLHSRHLHFYDQHQGTNDGNEGNQAYLSHVAGSMENIQTSVAEMVTTNNQIPQSQTMLMHFDPFTCSLFELEETKTGKEENLASLFDVAAGSKENTMTNMAMSTSTSMENMGEMEATNQEFPHPQMMLSDFDPFQYNFFQSE